MTRQYHGRSKGGHEARTHRLEEAATAHPSHTPTWICSARSPTSVPAGFALIFVAVFIFAAAHL